MEKKDIDDLTRLFYRLSEAISEWSDFLPCDRSFATVRWPENAADAFREYALTARMRVLAKLSVTGNSYLANLIDRSLQDAIAKGEAFSAACLGIKPPEGLQFWEDADLEDVIHRYDGPESELAVSPYAAVYRTARALFSALSDCEAAFEAADQAIRTSVAQVNPQSGAGRSSPTIPSEFRTSAMTKTKAVGYLRIGNPESAVEWLNKCIKDGIISCDSLTRQSHVFDLRDFPANAQAFIRPK